MKFLFIFSNIFHHPDLLADGYSMIHITIDIGYGCGITGLRSVVVFLATVGDDEYNAHQYK